METSVDAGTKRYMYNKLGLVSVAQDQFERTRMVGAVFTPRYRVYKYDDYGRMTGVGMMNVTLSGGQQYDPLYYSTILVGNIITPTFKYTYTNASTYDWLCSYILTTKSGTTPVNVSPSTFSISQWEKSFAYGLVPTQNTIGKLTLENSFNNTGTKILKNAYTYDAIGYIASQTTTFSPINADGTVNLTTSKIDYPSYNYRGSLLEEKVDVNNDNTTDLHLFYEYDRLNRLTNIRAALGSVALATDATLLVSYTYDIEGKITKKEHRIDDNSDINRLAMEIAYSYDQRNRLTEVNAVNATLSIAKYKLFYDAQNPISGTNTVVAHQNWNNNINGTLMEYNFSTADNGPITNFSGSTLYGFQYDAMNRMTKGDAAIADIIAQNPSQGSLAGDEEATYDKSGNITQLKRTINDIGIIQTEWWNYVYQSGTNKLTSVTGQNAYSTTRNYTYDANGNLLTDNFRQITSPMQYGRAAYTFRINKGPDLIDYLYDTKDQRIYKKLDAPGTTLDNEEYYLQDAMGRAIAIKQTNSAGTNWEYYLFGTEREMLLKPKANQAPGANASNTAKRVNLTQATAYLYDHLGNTRVAYMPNTWNTTLNKVTFNIEHVADYSPYGKIIRENVIIDKAKYLTTQHERDAETGLDYRGARYYDSDIARFLSLDPLACKYPSWSAYNYVLSNPMNLIDPTGKEAEDWFLNTQSGRMVYLKGKSEITQADLDKIGSPYSLSDYAWVGGDNIFGENLPVTLPKSNGTNPLEKDYLIVDEVFTELLMDYLGYEKAKQITIKEWEFVSGGRMGSENFSSTTFDMKQLGGEKICFILRDHLDASVNKFNDVKKITDQGRYSTITTVVYNTTIPYKQELPKISYFDEINTGKTLGKALGCVGTILDAYWENKKIKI